MAYNSEVRAEAIDEVFESATRSIEYAEAVMSKTRASVEKTQRSQETRNKIISKASEIVNALLEPASQVANLLDGLGGVFPPCKVASNALAALVKLEVDRRDNDVRIGLVYLDMSTTLVTLGTLKPGFQTERTLAVPLGQIIDEICNLMKEFGQFSEAFYDAKSLKSKLKHLLHSKSNSDKLLKFHDRITSYKSQITGLLSQQAVLILVAHTEILGRIERGLVSVQGFYASLSDEKEGVAAQFVYERGSEEIVQNDNETLEEFAETVEEALTPSVRRSVQESADETYRQTQASFMLKFQFALEQRIDESQEMILNELKSGPYELIQDPDVKEIWKNTAAKESSVKRRQFIDGLNYHFNVQFKKYKTEHNRAEREDSWTKAIISKVQFHPAIGDAIDDDASGYISVDELNNFMRKKPAMWSVPQWMAYWAYGWDADNFVYQGKINKVYKELHKLQDQGVPSAHFIERYIDETEERVTTFADSVYFMRDLDPPAAMKMDKMREEWRAMVESSMKKRLRSVGYKIDYSSISAISGSERVEASFLALASMLVSRHLSILRKPTVSEEDVDEAIDSMAVIVDVIHDRIAELKAIWRRQRMDVDTQIRYYANGMLEDYYKKYRAEEFDTDAEGDEESSWDSEDEWESEDEEADTKPSANTDKQVTAQPVSRHPSAPSQSNAEVQGGQQRAGRGAQGGQSQLRSVNQGGNRNPRGDRRGQGQPARSNRSFHDDGSEEVQDSSDDDEQRGQGDSTGRRTRAVRNAGDDKNDEELDSEDNTQGGDDDDEAEADGESDRQQKRGQSRRARAVQNARDDEDDEGGDDEEEEEEESDDKRQGEGDDDDEDDDDDD
ncbi:hypothetical protein FA95DRAFT_1554409 [Auriscalpium vulgare]|uniref:Uncharacterized protein n=1 Tax=Auriscalpium vulgare TaxID=40419 RepID=A0ACB8S5R0_9AGAM|nr:hypothetical protein FA95DRAFT_1554409 [Auriscalpium vulgare]